MDNFAKSYEMLAKLMANENIGFVIDPSLQTAMFDVKNRTLYLPVWDVEFKPLYYFVIGHEVGHALFTPFGDVWQDKDLKPILNIVEDYRIDIKMKQRLPGLVSDYRQGIEWLYSKNFMGSPGDIAQYFQRIDYKTFLSRLVLYLKVKANSDTYRDIPFTTLEKHLVKRCLVASSFDDVIQVSRDILEYLKNEKENQQQTQNGSSDESGNESENSEHQGDSQNNEGGSDSKSEANQNHSKTQTPENEGQSDSKNQQKPMFSSEIQDKFEQNMEKYLESKRDTKMNLVQTCSCDIVDISDIYSKSNLQKILGV